MADWTPVDQVAKNAEGKYVALSGGQWKPAGQVAKNKEGKYVAFFGDSSAEGKPGKSGIPSDHFASDDHPVTPQTPNYFKDPPPALASLEAARTLAQNAVVGGLAGFKSDSGPQGESDADKFEKKYAHIPSPAAASLLRPLAWAGEKAKPVTDELQKIGPVGEVASVLPSLTQGSKIAGQGIRSLPGAYLRDAAQTPYIGPVVRKAGEEAGMAGDALKQGLGAAKPRTPAQMQLAQQVEGYRAKGYVMPPNQANPGTLNGIVEGLAGKIKTQQGMSLQNQKVTDGIAKTVLGLSADAPLDADAIRVAKSVAGQNYAALDMVKEPFIPTRQYNAAIKNLGNATTALLKRFPNIGDKDSAAKITGLVSDLQGKRLSGAEVRQLTQTLREEADHLLRAQGSPSEKRLGRVYREASKSIEDMAEANLEKNGNADVLKNYRDSRQRFAQIYSVERAMSPSGHIDASKIAKELRKGKPLTGDLKKAAEFASQFPKAAQLPDKVGSVNPLDALDGLVAIGAAVASGKPVTAAVKAGAMLTGRPIIRKFMGSETGQNLMVGRAPQIPPTP